MGTTNEKLQAILNSKSAIKAAIEGKGVENVGDVLSTYADAISSIPTGGGGWTGHADVEGLKAIGWTDEDIAYYQEHGVNWNEEDDEYHKVPEDNKALYGVINIDNIQDYKNILVYLPKIDTSGVTNMSNKFSGCQSLVGIPAIDTSSATNMQSMLAYCYSLTYFPLIDTSKATNIIGLLNNDFSLISVLNLDMSSATNMQSMLSYCYSLQSIRVLNMSKVTNMKYIFNYCRSMSYVDADVASISDKITFGYCGSLRFCMLSNIKVPVDVSETSILEKSSLLYMIENAAPTEAITITLSAYCYNKFSNDPDVVSALSAQPLVSLASA